MADSVVDIVNHALDRIGQQPIMSMDEPGPNAARIRRIWPLCRDAVLREHVWKCATRRAQLAEVRDAPLFGFQRVFQLPPDFLRLIATEPEHAVVEIEGDSILTDEPRLALAYVARITDPKLFDATLTEALALKLAAELAFGITASTSLAQQLDAQYKERLRDARGYDAREGAGVRPQLGRWARAKLGG